MRYQEIAKELPQEEDIYTKKTQNEIANLSQNSP